MACAAEMERLRHRADDAEAQARTYQDGLTLAFAVALKMENPRLADLRGVMVALREVMEGVDK